MSGNNKESAYFFPTGFFLSTVSCALGWIWDVVCRIRVCKPCWNPTANPRLLKLHQETPLQKTAETFGCIESSTVFLLWFCIVQVQLRLRSVCCLTACRHQTFSKNQSIKGSSKWSTLDARDQVSMQVVLAWPWPFAENTAEFGGCCDAFEKWQQILRDQWQVEGLRWWRCWKGWIWTGRCCELRLPLVASGLDSWRCRLGPIYVSRKYVSPWVSQCLTVPCIVFMVWGLFSGMLKTTCTWCWSSDRVDPAPFSVEFQGSRLMSSRHLDLKTSHALIRQSC